MRGAGVGAFERELLRRVLQLGTWGYAQRFGGDVSHVFSHALRGFSLTLPEAAAAALQRDPRVELVEPDGEVTADTVQSNATWGIDRIDQHNLPLSGTFAYNATGHGTHVAGTIGGSTYGVAKAVMLVAVRVLNCNGSGTTSGVIAGVDWVSGNHGSGQPAVANMSLGCGRRSTPPSATRSATGSATRSRRGTETPSASRRTRATRHRPASARR